MPIWIGYSYHGLQVLFRFLKRSIIKIIFIRTEQLHMYIFITRSTERYMDIGSAAYKKQQLNKLFQRNFFLNTYSYIFLSSKFEEVPTALVLPVIHREVSLLKTGLKKQAVASLSSHLCFHSSYIVNGQYLCNMYYKLSSLVVI